MSTNPKYSLIEIERKWIVNTERLPDTSKLLKIEVTDKYFPGTRTRLRKMFYNATGEVKHKLTKKYGKITPLSEPLTTLYLSEFEYDLFNKTDGNVLTKTLYQYPYWENNFLIEFFTIPKVDFVLMEVEAKSEESINELKIPEFAFREVTNEKKFEGYEIALNNY